jgi:excisionase family DNA binding protein
MGRAQSVARKANEQVPANEPSDGPTVRLLDRKGLAHQLGVSPSTVFRWCRDGLIAFYRLGNRVAFSPKHVEDFLRSCEVQPRRNGTKAAAKAA